MTDELDVHDRQRTVVCAVPLKPTAMAQFAEMLGDARVVDIRDTVDVADVVLTPACSPQTVAALKAAYPSAELVVVELEDWDRDIDLSGPVIRLRRAGADAYLAADSLEDLARQLQPTASGEIAATTHDALPRELRSASVDDIVLHLLDERAASRAAAVQHAPTGDA